MEWLNNFSAGHYKLKGYVYFGDTDQGVTFDAGSESFIIKGQGLYPIIDKIVSLLDNGHGLTDIFNNLPHQLQGIFVKLVTSLQAHQMLHAITHDTDNFHVDAGHTVANELYQFAQDRIDAEPAKLAMDKWQQSQVVVFGHGYALKSAVNALIQSGVRNCLVFWDESQWSIIQRSEVENLITGLAIADLTIEFVLRNMNESDCANADMVLIASDGANNKQILSCHEWAITHGKNCIIASVFNGHACVAPPSLPGTVGINDLLFWLPSEAQEQAEMSPTSLAILGCVGVQNLISQEMGIEAEKLNAKAALISPYLEVTSHPLVPMLNEGAVARQLTPYIHHDLFQLPEDRILEKYELLKMALQPWFDPVFGCLSLNQDPSIEQMPLFQYAINLGLAEKERIVLGWGIDLAQAGLSAIHQAVAALATITLSEHHPVVVDTEERSWQEAAQLQAFTESHFFIERYQWSHVTHEQLTLPETQVLLRLLSYHSRIKPKIQLLSVADMSAYVAQISINDDFICAASANSAIDAINEVIGRCCSHFQLAASTEANYWQDKLPQFHPNESNPYVSDWKNLEVAAQMLSANAVKLQFNFHKITCLNLPESVICGYATIEG
jgi:hypothetical protein